MVVGGCLMIISQLIKYVPYFPTRNPPGFSISTSINLTSWISAGFRSPNISLSKKSLRRFK